MARPRSFDETKVLDRAMDLFWRVGFRGAGLAEILRHTGISRQSLYDTFGNKRGLFLRVLEHYRSTQLVHALALLERQGSPIGNVKEVVRFFQGLGQDPRGRGCLVANAVVELGPAADTEITALLDDTLALLQKGVEAALREARERGELGEGKSPAQLAGALTNAMVGMAVTGRLQRGARSLDDVYAGTLSMLD